MTYPPPPPGPPYPPPPGPPYPPPGQPGPPAYAYSYAAPPPYAAPRTTSGWAIASLVFGIVGGIVVSVICGIIALGRTKDGRQGGRGMAIAGLALSAAWTLGLIAIVAIAVLAGRGTVNATDVKVGDCITEVPERTRVLSVHTVACDQPHKGEVYAVLAMPDGDYPGQSTIDEYKDKCSPELLTYSPSALADPAIGVYVLYPSPETWEQGDHAVTCIASSDTPRTGSVKG